MTLLSRLREATADSHRSLECRLPLTSPDLTLDQYSGVLAAFYGYLRPWESAVRRLDWPQLQAVMADRWRAPLLAADLRHLGVADPDALPVCPHVPAADDPARALGSCYVLEGSTLGGQVVSKHLESALGLTNGLGYSYFRGAGPAETGRRWKQFLDWMVRQAEAVTGDAVSAAPKAPPRVDANAVIAGAVETFEALDAWFAGRSADGFSVHLPAGAGGLSR